MLVFEDYHSIDFEPCLAVFDSNVPDYFSPDERQEFIDFLLDLPGPYLVAKLNNEVVACGGFAFVQSDHSADLCWGMIKASEHKNQYGKQLLLARLERIRHNAEVHNVHLKTSQSVEPFFNKFGFTTEEVIPDAFAPGMDCYKMTLTI